MRAWIILIATGLPLLSVNLQAEDKTRFPHCDGSLIIGKFVDLGGAGRIFLRYSAFSDSGLEVTHEASDGVVQWRYYVKPLMIAHSSYFQNASILVKDNTVFVTSVGAKTINEEISVETGEKISRTITMPERGEQAVPPKSDRAGG